jgi:hypothetical protein
MFVYLAYLFRLFSGSLRGHPIETYMVRVTHDKYIQALEVF